MSPLITYYQVPVYIVLLCSLLGCMDEDMVFPLMWSMSGVVSARL